MAESARYLGVPPTTFATWAKGYVREPKGRKKVVGEPIVSTVETEAGGPSIPFVGLAEGMVLTAVRRSGVPMQRVRPALLSLQDTIGLDYALASKSLYTDGAELLYDYARAHAESPVAVSTMELVVVRSGQRVFTEVVADYLRRIEYAEDGYACLIYLPDYREKRIVVDPHRSFGQPIFMSGGVRVDDVLDRFRAGEALGDLAKDFGVPEGDLEDAVRVASRRAA